MAEINERHSFSPSYDLAEMLKQRMVISTVVQPSVALIDALRIIIREISMDIQRFISPDNGNLFESASFVCSVEDT